MARNRNRNTKMQPTRETYASLEQAYEALNRALFDGLLPPCLIGLERSAIGHEYFCLNRMARDDGMVADVIALDPAQFHDRPLPDILATLAHDMVHLWQDHFGQPGRGRYHNREWAVAMKAIGLQPTATGQPGGKETGRRMEQLIVAGGPLDRAAHKILEQGFAIAWFGTPHETEG
jgi:hypothetical protein